MLEAIDKGECTLFLGAGASSPTGMPSGEKLRDLITDAFLAGKEESERPVSLGRDWGLSLASAVSLAGAQPGIDRSVIEKFVLDRLSGASSKNEGDSVSYSPSPAHLKIPWFRWRAIVTTNYDRLIEMSYEDEEKEGRAIQEMVLVLKEKDLSDIGTTSSGKVSLLKPHGCISGKSSMSLSLEDIYQAKQERRLLFTYIELLHLLGPVIYIGYSFNDVHILDMIYDLTSRLGPYRKPILFVTLQEDPERAEKESNWIQGQLRGIYSADGFEQFMDGLAKQITPAIAPSMIIRQMAPCVTMTFASSGLVSDTAFYKLGRDEDEWEYWLTYSINHREGFAGVIFERRGEIVDIRKYVRVTFELNVPSIPGESRKTDYIEAKLESTLKRYELRLDIKPLRGKGWKEVSLPLRNKQNKPETVPRRLRRVVLADSGHQATIGREYRIGIRKIKFE
jgi:hypothetical protein